MLEAVLTFVGSTAVVVLAGVFLTRFADGIAEATGLGRLLVGSIFLAGATSLPELMVDVSAAKMGKADLAVGGIVGSSLFNLLILSLIALMSKARGRILSPEHESHSVPVLMSIILTAVAGMSMIMHREWIFANIGAGSYGIVFTYFYCIRTVFTDQKARQGELENEALPETSEKPGMAKPLIGYLACGTVIFGAAPYVARSSATLAELTGLGESFVGTTLVALATSLPELVTTIAAVRLGAFDLALGNIFGSNSFNILLLAPVDYFYEGSLLSEASPIHQLTCFAAIAVSCVALFTFLGKGERKGGIAFLRPGAPLMAILVVAALALIYAMGR